MEVKLHHRKITRICARNAGRNTKPKTVLPMEKYVEFVIKRTTTPSPVQESRIIIIVGETSSFNTFI
ncbi:unnamed protein product, partial [Nesidiocoris tenuis]